MNKAWEDDIQEHTPQNWRAHIDALNSCVEITNEVFRPGGILETQFNKPYRKGQHTMAMDVAKAFLNGKHLAAEAGTGTGKTLAYGVPAAILGVLHPGVPKLKDNESSEVVIRPFQTVISVHTLSLQDQLQEDFQLISDITLTATGRRPSTLRLSGRDNYFCEVSTQRMAQEADEPGIKDAAQKLLDEYNQLKTEGKIISGLTSELPSWNSTPPEMRKLFSANEINCALHKGNEHCNYDRTKARIPKSNLLSINHNLLAIGWPGTWHQKVIDEAHTIEPVVVESTQLETCIDKLERAMTRPNVTRDGPPGVRFKLSNSVCINIVEISKDIENLVTDNKIRRVRGPLSEDLTESLDKLIKTIPQMTADGISGIAGAKSIKSGDIKNFFEKGSIPDIQGIGADYHKAMDALRNIKMFYTQAQTILEFSKGPNKEDSTLVHWTEEAPPEQKGRTMLRITEADARPALQSLHAGTTSIMTSATLAGPRGMQSFVESQGLTEENCSRGEYLAPFKLEEKMKIVIPPNIPEPGRDEKRWKEELPKNVLKAIMETQNLPGGGGSLVLLTSRADLKAVAQYIEPILSSHGINMLAQDGNMERKEMVDQMKKEGKTVLLGLDSFWTGIDVPGNALRHVIISRVPFQVPSPLNDARKEIVEARGQNAFQEVDLRNAVSTMRQGIGRLIRTMEDNGLVTILDPRVSTKSYGKFLLDRLPEPSSSYKEHVPIEIKSNNYQNWNNRGAYKKQAPAKPAFNPCRAPSVEEVT